MTFAVTTRPKAPVAGVNVAANNDAGAVVEPRVAHSATTEEPAWVRAKDSMFAEPLGTVNVRTTFTAVASREMTYPEPVLVTVTYWEATAGTAARDSRSWGAVPRHVSGVTLPSLDSRAIRF